MPIYFSRSLAVSRVSIFLFLILLALLPSAQTACHATCLLCAVDDSPTDCTSCDGILHRAPDPASPSPYQCICDIGWIDAADTATSPACISGACDYTCSATCRGSATYCESCQPSSGRILSATSTCQCGVGLYDNGVQTCGTCSSKCRSCSGSSTTCTDCYSSQFRSLNAPNCDCITGYYDSGSDICSACSYKCTSCSGSATTCSTCAGGATRSGTPGCACVTKYYDDGSSANCLACNYRCATCTAGNSCATCDSATKKRGLSSVTGYCQCITRYYDDGTNQQCASCHQTCLTCSGSSSTNCLSCNSTASREFDSSTSSCKCKQSYYQTGATVQLCASCHVTCLTCSSSSASSCLSCPSTLHRSTLSSGSCPCDAGYYNTNNVCLSCDSSCATCTSSSACATCPSATQIVDTVTGRCICASIKYWDSGTSACVACNAKCSTCSISATNCTSCDISTNKRILSSSTYECLCTTGYYDSGATVCSACNYKCLTCDANGCVTCNSNNKRVKSGTDCLCSDGYYDDGTNQACKACASTCATCGTSATNCLSCDGVTKYRQLSLTSCICKAGYFDSGSSICSACSYKCATCVTTASNCQTCAGTATRSTAPSCACIAQHYDDGSSANCLTCSYSCLGCTNLTACSTCDSTKFRVLDTVGGFCKCTTRYYDDGTNQLCLACHATCLTCLGGSATTDCRTCNSTAQRSFDTATSACLCLPKYYQTSATTQLCSPCHATCLTCSSSAITGCLTCSASEQRILDPTSTGKCLCAATFYLSSSFSCLSCHSSCATCSSISLCDTCPYPTQSVLANGTCGCVSTTAWDSSTTACTACHVSCATCTGTITNCTSCNGADYRNLKSNACVCITGYYDNSVATCAACGYQCVTCDSSGCLTCDSTKQRKKSSTTCACNDGYYDDGVNMLCLQCHYTCKTCTAASACTACNPLIFRVSTPDATTNLCPCTTKYYQDTVSLTCKPCLYHCATCSVGDRCQTCTAAKFRTLNTTTTLCQCDNRYYDDGVNQLCKSCHYSCETCTNVTVCVTCNLATNFRQYSLSTKKCVCIAKYYESAANTVLCSACHFSCAACSSTSSTCTSCNSTANRVLSSSACPCKTGYFSNGVEQCVACHYSCLTCADASTCASCDSGTFRTLSGTCACPTLRYYDDGSTKFCHTCHYSCQSCTDGASCGSCDSAKFRIASTPYCICMDGYYSDGINQLCLACPYQCTTCTNSSECLTCDGVTNFRQQPANVCICMDKYYNSGTNPICQPCQYSCKTCIVGNQCITCNALLYREKDLITKLCKCNAGYFDDGLNNQLCLACDYTCKQCTTTALTCTKCESAYHRTLSTSSCPCDQYYYDDLVNPLCLPCQYSCLTCIDSLTCDTCDPAKKRQYNPTTDLCSCIQRYFDDGFSNQMCVACEETCLECLDADSCTDCDQTMLRFLNATANYANVTSPYCLCQYKYYAQTDPQAICLACHYTCAVCSGPLDTDCLFCTADAHRQLKTSTHKCPCIDGYFDNLTSVETCLACHPWCLKCTNYTTTSCTKCDTAYFLKIDVTTCFDVCPMYFWGKTSTMTCQACQAHCKSCTNATNCLVCDAGWPLWKGDCVQPCPAQSTFQNTTINQCIQCPVGCLTCTSLIACQSCKTNYYLDAQLHLCFDCNPYCKGCTGPAQNQCIDCNYPLYLNGSQCFNISCPYGQYIDSHSGCLECKSLFPNSLTCTIDNPTLCQSQYRLLSTSSPSVCTYCTQVPGFTIASTGNCAQVCGDGVLKELQCDDGNTEDGDGCANNCIIESGWHCTVDANGKSICGVDGSIGIKLVGVFKYGGKNKIKLNLELTTAIRLNSRYFLLTFTPMDDPNSVTWQFFQNQTDLKYINFVIIYTETLQTKKISLSYDTTRRLLLSQTQLEPQTLNSISPAPRLLVSLTLTFSQTFTISSYPPAYYYSPSQQQTNSSLKNVIYIGSNIVLCLCALMLLSPRKMYMLLGENAWIPGVVFVQFGLVMEERTDWIKWGLDGLKEMAFIGGFRVGNYPEGQLTPHFLYSYQITKNAGISCSFLLASWCVYTFLTLSLRFCFKSSLFLPSLLMYLRYVLLTAQILLLPHLTYSAINALYNTSLISQTSPVNVCLAIIVNVYLIGFVGAAWMAARGLKVRQEILMIQDRIQREERGKDGDGSEIGERSQGKASQGKMNQTKQQFFIDLEHSSGEDIKTEKGFAPESNRSQIAIFKMVKDPLSNQKDPRFKNTVKKSNDNLSEEQINQSNVNQNYQYYDGIGYWSNHREIYKKIQQQYKKQWLIYDYVQLYATGGYQVNKLQIQAQKAKRPKTAENSSNQPQQPLFPQPLSSSQLTLRKFSLTKYFLPLSLTKVYLTFLLCSALKTQPLILYSICAFLEIMFIFYLIFVRPFKFSYTNFRIFILEILLLVMNCVMAYYGYQWGKGIYQIEIEKAMIGLIASYVVWGVVGIAIEGIGAWRVEIWNRVQPCLVAMRLRGARKVMEYRYKGKRGMKIGERIREEKKVVEEEEKEQAMDAFFARMLKKQSIQKQYRRERLMKNPVAYQ